LSLAIGKKGQNVRLAAKLTGWRIDIKSEEEKRREVEAQFGLLEGGDAAAGDQDGEPSAAGVDGELATGADSESTAVENDELTAGENGELAAASESDAQDTDAAAASDVSEVSDSEPEAVDAHEKENA
jgi:N utilization substance protein A